MFYLPLGYDERLKGSVFGTVVSDVHPKLVLVGENFNNLYGEGGRRFGEELGKTV